MVKAKRRVGAHFQCRRKAKHSFRLILKSDSTLLDYAQSFAVQQAAFAGYGTSFRWSPSKNTEMGRIFIRRGGETIAASEYLCGNVPAPLTDMQDLC